MKILLITLGVLAVGLLLMLALREPVQAPQTAPAPVQVENQEDAKKDESVKQAENLPSRVTAVASGTVLAVTDGSFTLKTIGGEEMEIKIVETSSFYAMENGKVSGKTKEDVKNAVALAVEYDTATKEAVSVRIGK